MADKVDVIVVFYQHESTWPECLKGLRANLDYINKIFVVKDGEWGPGDVGTLELASTLLPNAPIEWLGWPKNGHGVARNLNRAMELCETEYVLVTTAKQRIQPGYVEELLVHARYGRIVLAPVHNVRNWPDGPITKPDAYTSLNIPEILRNGRGWTICRNGATLFHRPTYRTLGGHDEEFCGLGYGNEDYELGCRWLAAGGDIVWTNATHSVRPDDTRAFEDRGEKQVSAASFDRLARSALALFGHRAFLFVDGRPLNLTLLQVAHDNNRGDVKVDCLKLGWVPEAGLKEAHIIPNSYLLQENPLVYAQRLWEKVAPGGKVVLWGGGLTEQYEYAMKLAGFEVDVLEARMECFKGEDEE